VSGVLLAFVIAGIWFSAGLLAAVRFVVVLGLGRSASCLSGSW
jgi:hypothetical protein